MSTCAKQKSYTNYTTTRFSFRDLLTQPVFHHSVWSVITARKLTRAKRHVIGGVTNGQARLRGLNASVAVVK